jgi:hypothetical protein
MKMPPGKFAVYHFDSTDLNNLMTQRNLKPGSFRI